MTPLAHPLRAVLAALLVLVCVTAAAPPGHADEVPVGAWPLRPEPEVVEGFDPPEDPWGAGHRGVDLLGSPAQRVRAALPGTIAFVGRLAGRGVVVVSHGDTRTTYEPVGSDRSVGDPVAAGDVIGRLELPGSHCFPRACLHWGWLRGETYLDPLLLVGAGPVRLLPLWRDLPASTGPSAWAGPAGVAALSGPSDLSGLVVRPWAGWRAPIDLWRAGGP